MSIREKIEDLMDGRERITMRFKVINQDMHSITLYFWHTDGGDIFVEWGYGVGRTTMRIRSDGKFVLESSPDARLLRSQGDFFASLIRDGPELVTANFFDPIRKLFEKTPHDSGPVCVRLDRESMHIKTTCDIYREDEDYTAFLTKFIWRASGFRIDKELVSYFALQDNTIRGYCADYNKEALARFLQWSYRILGSRVLQSESDPRLNGEGLEFACSQFYFIRTGDQFDKTARMSEQMRQYIANPNLFKVSDAVRRQVLGLIGESRWIDGKKTNLTIRRILTAQGQSVA